MARKNEQKSEAKETGVNTSVSVERVEATEDIPETIPGLLRAVLVELREVRRCLQTK